MISAREMMIKNEAECEILMLRIIKLWVTANRTKGRRIFTINKAPMRKGLNTVMKRYVDEISNDDIEAKLPVPKNAKKYKNKYSIDIRRCSSPIRLFPFVVVEEEETMNKVCSEANHDIKKMA